MYRDMYVTKNKHIHKHIIYTYPRLQSLFLEKKTYDFPGLSLNRQHFFFHENNSFL